MQIYLLKDLKGHGKAGEIVNLNDGYAKNFVIKSGFGKVVDNAVLSYIKAKKDSDKFKHDTEVDAIKDTIAKLNATQVVIKAKLGANGKLFGGITATEIAGELSKSGIHIDKRNIQLHDAIKTVGAYKIDIKFGHGLSGNIAVIIEGV